MSRREWIAVGLVIGLGLVWQIPRHDDAVSSGEEPHTHAPAEVQGMERGRASVPADAANVAGPYRTITLEVTGMT
jgi:hypothetical protein